MSDASVSAALRSQDPFVVVEAPAGCGKTYQGAEYARQIATAASSQRLLILTHTHAACSVFAERTKGIGSHVEIRTIDSLIAQIAGAYHRGLNLPADIATWVRQDHDRYVQLASRVDVLLKKHPMISDALAKRYRIVICDEHQDSSGDQHSILMSLLPSGVKLRIFGDPMQQIFKDSTIGLGAAACKWTELQSRANSYEQLDFPHRWSLGCPLLGKWTLAARDALKSGGTIDLRTNLPPSVIVVFAENQSQKTLDYQLSGTDRKIIDGFERKQDSLLILTRYNPTARSFRGFFSRRILLWEGHTRDHLEGLVDSACLHHDSPKALAAAVVAFMKSVGKGFSASAFADRFEQEVKNGCKKPCRGKPVAIQELAKVLLAEPNHRGISKVLRRLSELTAQDTNFAEMKIDHYREFWEAVSLGKFDAPDTGLAEITNRRTYSRPKPPDKAISNIHKAKGLECESVILMPCDARTFPDDHHARCLLYVALSRAKSKLMIVASRSNPSPLFAI
jgi:DNA helicase-2/ATP-dependent DNA helicase PcrA